LDVSTATAIPVVRMVKPITVIPTTDTPLRNRTPPAPLDASMSVKSSSVRLRGVARLGGR
jgi:hypothetical protein